MNAIFDHVSIREYKNKPVETEKLEKILKAATRASTTGNMQIYSIIVSQSKEVKEELLPLHFNQKMVTEAPVVLTFCADLNRFSKWCNLRNAKPVYNNMLWFINAATDALLAAQNACIAAETEGLGICYLGTTVYMANKIIETLQLPEGVVPVTTVVMGYPNEKPERTDRLPLDAVVHYEKYSDYSDNDIEKLYAEKEALELTKELIKENKTQNLAQIFTEKRYKKADNLHFSKQFLTVLEQQGFMNNEE